VIAVGQAKAGDVAGAQQTANGIVNDASAKNREDAMAEVAIALADTGDIAGAEKTENLLPMDYDVSAVNAELAVGQAQAGDVKRALATVDHLNEHERRGWRFKISAVSIMAKVQGRTGDVTGARAWISTLGSSELEASALTGLAEGLIEGDSKKSQAVTRK
jgi:CO dehydrogenase/acetyl-CoA synthase gamma subunit (corrinoid Fe-S protein)